MKRQVEHLDNQVGIIGIELGDFNEEVQPITWHDELGEHIGEVVDEQWIRWVEGDADKAQSIIDWFEMRITVRKLQQDEEVTTKRWKGD